MTFKGKVVLITGASAGIGAGTAELFAERGANVVLVGRNLENLQEYEKKCKVTNKEAQTLIIQADVTTDAERIINETIKKFSRLDVLVNNAGVYRRGYLMASDINELDYLMNTNVRAVHILTKLAVPYLLLTKGNIVNVSSLAGIAAHPGAFNYCLTKAALDQFTKCLAMELAPQQVRVNSVNPATIETDILMRAGMTDEEMKKHFKNSVSVHPIGRIGHVMDVAHAIVFLASDEASFITGSILPIDGGRSTLAV